MNVIYHQDLSDFASRGEKGKTETKVYDKLMYVADLIGEWGKSIRTTKHTKRIQGTQYDELLFSAAGGVWRVLYLFDGDVAVLLAMGNKKGVKDSRFYKRLVLDADRCYADYLKWKTQENGPCLFLTLK